MSGDHHLLRVNKTGEILLECRVEWDISRDVDIESLESCPFCGGEIDIGDTP